MFLDLTIVLRELVNEVSADSGLQLDLEIALNVVSALNGFGVETSGDIIERFLRSPRKIVELYLRAGRRT
jgi:hypothetical protein